MSKMVAVEFFMVLRKGFQNYLLRFRRCKRRLFDLFLYFGINGLLLFLLDVAVRHRLCGYWNYFWRLLLCKSYLFELFIIQNGLFYSFYFLWLNKILGDALN